MRYGRGLPPGMLAVAAALGVGVAASPALVAAPASKGSAGETRIYWIGNSVTDALKYPIWKQTAEADGQTITWGRMMIPGAPISWLWDHPNDGFTEPPYGAYSTALVNYVWDFISLQPYDRSVDEYPDGDLPMSLKFMNLVAVKSPKVQFLLFGHYPRQAWINQSGGYQPHWAKPYRGTPGGNETRDFYDIVIQKIRQQQPKELKPILLVPVGEVFFELDKKMRAGQIPGKADIVSAAYADAIHQNDFGCYIVGCSYYAVMFKKNPAGFSGSRYGVTGTAETVIQQTVWDVVRANPLAGVSDSLQAEDKPAKEAPKDAAKPKDPPPGKSKTALDQVPSDPSKFYLYVFMGQSNMSGMAPVLAEDMVAKPRVYKFTSDGTWAAAKEVVSTFPWAKNFAAIGKQCVGPAKTVGEAIADMKPDIVVGLVGVAVSGSNIESWQRDQGNYQNALRILKEAMKSGTLKGAFWHQGEANNGTPAYDRLLTNLISNLRQDTGVPNLPFIMGQIGTTGDSNGWVNAALNKVKAAVPFTAVASSAGLRLCDNVHYDNPSQKLMGARMAEAYKPFLNLTAPASPAATRKRGN